MAENDNEILTVEELATYLRMNERTIYKLAHEGKLPAVKIASQWRFKRSLINQWLDHQMGSFSNNLLARVENGIKENHFDFSGLLRAEHVNLDIHSQDRDGVLWELVEKLVETSQIKDPSLFFKELQQREELLSTGHEEGVAFPHPRKAQSDLFDHSVLVIGRSDEGVDYGAVDGMPTYLFFMIGAAHDSHHLQILARLNRVLKQPSVIEKLLEASTPEEVLGILQKTSDKLPKASYSRENGNNG